MKVKSRLQIFLKVVSLFLAAIFLCTVLFRVGSNLYENHKLREGFSLSTDLSSYQQGTAMEEMDLTEYEEYFPTIFTLTGYSLTHRIKTPVALRYYNDIPLDDSSIAYEIPKDTEILAIPKYINGAPLYEIGYGYTSYPTYEKGWRYVRPFSTDNAINPGTGKYYYVRLEELEAVIKKVMDENKVMSKPQKYFYWSDSRWIREVSLKIDSVFYSNGVYFSRDMLHDVFTLTDALLAGAGLILAGGWLAYPVLFRHTGKKVKGKA